MTSKSSRRQFISKLAIATTAGAIGLPRTAASTPAVEFTNPPHRFATPPYLQALTPTSVSIVCLTTAKAYTWVAYGETDLSNRTHTVNDGLVDAHTTLTCIKIDKLRPGTTYKYRVISKAIDSFQPYKLEYGEEITSEIYEFTTPQENATQVSCIILNDIHDRPQSFSELMYINKDRDFDFVVLNGDTFDYQTDESQLVDHLLNPLSDIFSSTVPFIMNRGNHETRGKFAREFRNYFDFPQGKYYQAFQQGPVFWIMLDTGEDKPDDTAVYAGIVDFDTYREEQARWLEQVMRSDAFQKTPFRVVVMHIPPFHSGDWHGTMHCRKLFAPLFDKYGVHLVVSGHTHKYGIHEPQAAHTYPIVIGGSPRKGERTLIHIQADKSPKLVLTMTRDDGFVIGTVMLGENGKILERAPKGAQIRISNT